MCARDIDISQLGDHICGGFSEPTPPLESSSTFDKMPPQQVPSNKPAPFRPSKNLPPRVDTSAANRPYFPQDQLTPVSASSSRYGSSVDGRNSPYKQPLRSATAPLFRIPSSPEFFSSNLDSPFPTFPTPQNQSRLKPQQARGYGGQLTAADPMYAPVSPRTPSSGGFLQRMNTIAPGPFDMKRRKEVEAVEKVPAPAHRKQGSEGSLKDMIMGSRTDEDEPINRPSTTEPGHQRTLTGGSNGSRSEFSGKGSKKNGYGGFGAPTAEPESYQEPLRSESRSQTFPLENPSQAGPLRRPTDPIPSSRERHNVKPSISGPILSRPLPPRGASLIRPRLQTPAGNVPPVPDLNLAAEFGIGNPYHTPTDSQSSDTSGFSATSQASSRSSPPRSPPRSIRGEIAEVSPVDSLMADLETTLSMSPQKEKSSPRSPPRNLQPASSGLNASPIKSTEQFARPLAPPPVLKNMMLAPESPMDPAIQHGRLSPAPLNTSRPDYSRNNSDRRPASSKGNCKGCSEPIKGKSISSADGRLTGRYHKHCFVCNTCQEPFKTATFYVIDDAPYCERHYHKLNGSTCTTCDKGIEGQYLESERKQKFHPHCLACADCKRILKRDYFEMNGRVYCERDAWKRSQQPKSFGNGGLGVGTNRMERRTTRLMMM
ncbi:Glucocorticoid receptor-like (DNA-binding) [Glarea lozoyensis ATCC 20868]|uniref:Glucocorticoid receptor-like (DNA-binding) n=1 Tax=Glarea lozoyensis (strain ATCC 20868 / MF5171) TaxID=1116229 RepID=S3CQG7_GLAL2|nr:Glucocorticoid receptor-like (DNA-binding) [Glarea lozoyensis ATCC 20868]EPE27349.1 Glucocorticoid receptor-like (DNA-binding) [Glarea lozoyensis ATCC 20868]